MSQILKKSSTNGICIKCFGSCRILAFYHEKQAASTLGVCFSALFTICVCQVGPSIRGPEPSGKLEHTTRQKNPQNFWHARGTPTTAPIFPKILGLIMEGQFGQNVNKAEKPSPLYTRCINPRKNSVQKFNAAFFKWDDQKLEFSIIFQVYWAP